MKQIYPQVLRPSETLFDSTYGHGNINEASINKVYKKESVLISKERYEELFF